MDTKLFIVEVPDRDASILNATTLPVFKGEEEDNLLCGSCSVVLGQGVSERSCRNLFAVPVHLLIRCPKCGKYNKVPAQVPN